METTFTVKTNVFEGPLELLLDLIEKRKLLVNDISLAAVTDDYIAHLKREEELPVGKTAHFLVIASTLLLIKSKSLLPVLSLSEEEEGDIADLERRLKMYALFRSLSAEIGKNFGKKVLFTPEKERSIEAVFAPSKDLSSESILSALRSVLAALPKKVFTPEAVVEKVIHLEEVIDKLALRISTALSLSFREFAGMGKAKKTDVIVSFLALLELVKRGAISAAQQEHFADIMIESQGVSTPHYGV